MNAYIRQMRRAKTAYKQRLPLSNANPVFLVFLLLSSIPSVSNMRLYFPLLGTMVGVSFTQLSVIVFSSLSVLIRKRPIDSYILKIFFYILWLMIISDFSIALIVDPSLLVVSLRGIFNLSINLFFVILISHLTGNRLNAKNFSNTVVVFGILIALSAIGEFTLLKTSTAILERWRTFVWGTSIPADMLFTAGGTILDPEGASSTVLNPEKISRVGGLIGAPENLGLIIALTLPFIVFTEIPLNMQIWVYTLYFLTAAVSGSRTLAIALFIFMRILFMQRESSKSTNKIAIVIMSLISLSLTFWFHPNPEALERFGQGKLLYEVEWRSRRLLALLGIMVENERAWVTGLGLGWGAEKHFGLESMTSGILGGDLAVAYGLGGFIGLIILLSFWRIFLKLWVQTGHSFFLDREKIAINTYMLFVMILSTFGPVLMLFILSSGTITWVILAFLVMVEGIIKSENRRE